MNTPTPAQALGENERLARELQEAATDNDTRIIARILAEIAEESGPVNHHDPADIQAPVRPR